MAFLTLQIYKFLEEKLKSDFLALNLSFVKFFIFTLIKPHSSKCFWFFNSNPKWQLYIDMAAYGLSYFGSELIFPWTKWPPFRRRLFQMYFLEWKFLYFNSNFTKFVPKGAIDNKPALVQVMAWRQTGDKPLPEPVLTQFPNAYMRH